MSRPGPGDAVALAVDRPRRTPFAWVAPTLVTLGMLMLAAVVVWR